MCAPLTPYPSTPTEFVEYQDWWSLMYPSEPEEEEAPQNSNPPNPLRKIRERCTQRIRVEKREPHE
jgi:hypothetical protein